MAKGKVRLVVPCTEDEARAIRYEARRLEITPADLLYSLIVAYLCGEDVARIERQRAAG